MTTLSIKSMAAAALIMAFGSVSAHAAESSTKITFPKDSYCGSFAGDIQDGKVFRLWLSPQQNLVVSNIGDDQISVAYASDGKQRLEGDRYGADTSFYTKRKGNHYVKVYGNSHHSAVDFCVY
ncbi:hypothetical protein [Psychrobacter aestuarii]|nr:hypothetical protein [Psychrobacter aestuarii]